MENNAWNLEHNAEKLQEIWNRIMQRIIHIITSALESVNLRHIKQSSRKGMYDSVDGTRSHDKPSTFLWLTED